METSSFLKIPLDTIIAVLSFAISVGGFIPIFFMHDRRKEIAIAIALAILVVFSVIAGIRSYAHYDRIRYASNEVIRYLGPDSKTFDHLYEDIHFTSLPDLNEAMENLVKGGIVGHRVVEIYDDEGKPLRFRVFFLRMNR